MIKSRLLIIFAISIFFLIGCVDENPTPNSPLEVSSHTLEIISVDQVPEIVRNQASQSITDSKARSSFGTFDFDYDAIKHLINANGTESYTFRTAGSTESDFVNLIVSQEGTEWVSHMIHYLPNEDWLRQKPVNYITFTGEAST